jgi:hypothetical protein
LRTNRKTIRKIDLPALFNQLYKSALTPKQVVAGFSRAGIWPFDSNAMQDKVVKQPLSTKQLNPLPPTIKYYNIFDLQTNLALTITFLFLYLTVQQIFRHHQHKRFLLIIILLLL